MQQLSLLLEVRPARRSASPGNAAGCLTREAASCWLSSMWSPATVPAGSSGKTSPVFCTAGADGIFPPSSGAWLSAGIAAPGGCLTLSFSEYPNAAAVSSLSDILETGSVPQRFFLSARACAGILRRAEVRRRVLPERLRLALEAVAQS